MHTKIVHITWTYICLQERVAQSMHKITLIAWETRQKMSVSHKMQTRQAGLEEKLQIPAAAESLRS